MSYKKYWIALAIVIIGSFAVLGGVGRQMINQAPPLPDVYATDGQLLFTGSSITDGQGVWQSIGGQEIGTVWGHGAYVAPDWSADWLHRESNFLLDTWAARAAAAANIPPRTRWKRDAQAGSPSSIDAIAKRHACGKTGRT